MVVVVLPVVLSWSCAKAVALSLARRWFIIPMPSVMALPIPDIILPIMLPTPPKRLLLWLAAVVVVYRFSLSLYCVGMPMV